MKIIEVTERNTDLISTLVNVWEKSVKATHLFLSNEEIENIKQYVPEALNSVPHLFIAVKDDSPVAFMGINNQKLEMLFVSPSEMGKGIGKALVSYGFENYRINEVVVNEQNPKAQGFYEHMGFQVYKRSELDEQGMPYPVLYMKFWFYG